MIDNLEKAKKSLDEFYDVHKEMTDKPYEMAKSYLEWVSKKTKFVEEEKDFLLSAEVNIGRGDVYWAELGHNIDEEYGGRHPVVVLRRGGNTAIVIPLSTQEPPEDQKVDGIYAEIKKVYGGFKNMERWVNVLNTSPISIQRFDFKKPRGFIKGPDLDRINAAMKASGLWRI